MRRPTSRRSKSASRSRATSVTRKSDELREEERIVVYRKLIQDMLLNGMAMPDDRTRHVVAELLNSIFDVDKMLYFVAPEWWRPRLHRSRQQMQRAPTRGVLDHAAPLVTGTAAVLQKGLVKNLSSRTVRRQA